MFFSNKCFDFISEMFHHEACKVDGRILRYIQKYAQDSTLSALVC